MSNTEGISFWVLGDFGPFSRMGKSIGYLVSVGGSRFLIDCGAPLFSQIGGHGLADIDSLILTHCHDDHKRWFTDLALFHKYAPDFDKKVSLLTSEEVHAELMLSASAAMDRSLSIDSKKIVDIPYEDYVDFRPIGPRPRFGIARTETGGGTSRLHVVQSGGEPVGPDKAKVVVSKRTGRPRLLLRDPERGEWVEPESYYSFGSDFFYHTDKNLYQGDGFSIEAVKAPVWHGIPGIGVKISTARETLLFSSDTVHDVELWEVLYTEKRPQSPGMGKAEFEAAEVITGDINDYIERTWSEQRYSEAMKSFTDTVVVQDVSARHSIVHTDYVRLGHTLLSKDKALLTHCPDKITSEWALCFSEKTFCVRDGKLYELVGGRPLCMDADVYHKENGKFFVGFRSPDGKYPVYECDGLLGISLNGTRAENTEPGSLLFHVDLYEDVGGGYYPVIDDTDLMYFLREDGKVELVKFDETGSTGRVVEDLRESLPPKSG